LAKASRSLEAELACKGAVPKNESGNVQRTVMSETRLETRWSWFCGAAAFAALLYILSAAPVAAVLNQGWISGGQFDVYARVYAPVLWLHTSPVGAPLQRYWDFWNPPSPYIYY
jgi:hypothetical protein